MVQGEVMSDQKEEAVSSICTRLEFILGDITKAEVDAIVNPTDIFLSGGGSLDLAIHRAGGYEVDQACKEMLELHGGCETGNAVITTAGNLSAKYIIHTVGPIWMGGGIGEADLLANCYQRSLLLAGENRIKSIAFPAISTGTFKYPIDKAAYIALNTVIEFVKNAQMVGDEVPNRIQFFLYDEIAFICYAREIAKHQLSLSCVLS